VAENPISKFAIHCADLAPLCCYQHFSPHSNKFLFNGLKANVSLF